MKYWTSCVFKGIVELFGKFLAVDRITQNKYRRILTRFCVNVPVNTILPTQVTLHSRFLSWVQPIEYENSRTYGQAYKNYGHFNNECEK